MVYTRRYPELSADAARFFDSDADRGLTSRFADKSIDIGLHSDSSLHCFTFSRIEAMGEQPLH